MIVKQIILAALSIILVQVLAFSETANECFLDYKITLDVIEQTGAETHWCGLEPYSPEKIKEDIAQLRKEIALGWRERIESIIKERTEWLLEKEPEYRTNAPLYFAGWLGRGGNGQKFFCVLDESRGAGTGYDLLYVDANNNGDLTDDDKFVGLKPNDKLPPEFNRQFGPIKVMVNSAEGRIPYHCQMATYGNDLLISTACYRVGKVKIGQDICTIALVDSTSNGFFNDSGQDEFSSDMIAIDSDNDGKFDKHFWYTKYISLGKKWYTFEVSDDGSWLRVTQPQITEGVLNVPYDRFVMQLITTDGLLHLEGDGYKAKLPIGVYQFSKASYEATNTDGSIWKITEYAQENSQTSIVIEPDKATDFAFGAPLSLEVSSKKAEDGTIEFKLDIIGQAKGQCIITVNNECSFPSLRISSEDGQFSELYKMGYG